MALIRTLHRADTGYKRLLIAHRVFADVFGKGSLVTMDARKIFYYCYDHQRPKGGQKDTYQHVDILREAGYEAYALHTASGYRLSWFENNTPTISEEDFRQTYDPRRDYIVIPEDFGKRAAAYPGRKVIFNKSIFLGFRAQVDCEQIYDDQLRDTEAIFTVSEHNRRHLQFAYPHKRIELVRYDIRPDIFHYVPLHQKKPLIACVPKEPNQVAVLQQMLRVRSRSGASRVPYFDWIFIHNRPEWEVTQILRRSLIFVFLSTVEGLPRMPLEAMASGCLVVSYACPPLTEYLPTSYGFRQGDLVEIARFLEQIAGDYPSRLSRFQGVVQQARAKAEEYSKAQMANTVIAAWQRILSNAVDVPDGSQAVDQLTSHVNVS